MSWPGILKTSQQLVTWQLGVIKITHICGSKDGGNDRNNGFLASILLPSTPIMLACLHEFSSPPPLGNACHADYNLKIDRIFRTPSPPKLMTGKWHILVFGGLHPLFQEKGDLLAVPVYSVRNCDLGQNRWKSKVKIDPTQGWDVLPSPWFWSDGGPVPPGNILIPANTECNRYSKLIIPEVYIVCRVVYICRFWKNA